MKIPVYISILLTIFLSCNDNTPIENKEEENIQWPNGNIVFVSDRDGHEQLYIMESDSTGITRLTNNNYDDSSPKWSPDGIEIIFTRFKDSVYKTYIMDADGLNDKPISDSTYNELSPNWFPDGKKIIFQKIIHGISGITLPGRDSSRLYSIEIDGKNGHKINTNLKIYFPLGPAIRGEIDPSVSNDGNNILFCLHNTYRYGSYDIFSCNIDGTNLANITDINGDPSPYFYSPTYSPDGNKILFCKNNSSYDDDINSIYIMNSNGSNQIRLTDKNSSNNSHPMWSKDGRFIIFDSDRDGNKQIYIMDAKGIQANRISKNLFNDTEPDIFIYK